MTSVCRVHPVWRGLGLAARLAQPMWAWLRAVNHQAALCGWAGHIVGAAAGQLVFLLDRKSKQLAFRNQRNFTL